jgi:hypothetical protein
MALSSIGRPCTVCAAKPAGVVRRVPMAIYVATSSEGIQWFECGGHDDSDNTSGARRVKQEPIGEWFARMATLAAG